MNGHQPRRKRRAVRSALLLALALLLSTLAGAPSHAVDDAHITGQVTGAGGVALPDVNVTVYEYDATWDEWSWYTDTYTAANGTYDIGGLPAGTYRVGYNDWEGRGYIEEYYDNAATVEAGTDLVLAEDQVRVNVNAQLSRGGSISGTVTNAAAAGLANIDVTVYQDDGSGFFDWVDSTSTAANGTYTVAGLAAGTYRVGFEDFDGVYAPEYWNDKPDIEVADDIVVAAEGTVTGKNAVLGPPATITGRVTNQSAAGIAGIDVTAYEQVGGDYEYATSATTGADGNYLLGGLSGGTYKIAFYDYDNVYRGEYWNDKPDLDAADEVVVAAGATVTGKNAVLATPGKITGRVTNAGGTGLAGVEVTVYDEDLDWVDQVTTTATGTYAVPGLDAGTYRLGFEDPSGQYAPEFWSDKATLTAANAIPVALSTTVTGKNATLATASHITGQVTNSAGAGIAGIEVTAYSYVGFWREFRTTTTAAGTYDINGLSAETYRIGYHDPGSVYSDEYWNDKTLFRKAHNVGVGASTTVAGKNAVLTRDGRISGKVTNSGGTAIPGIEVSAYELVEGDWRFSESVQTNASGDYTIPDLRATTHRLHFRGTSNHLGEYYDNGATIYDGTDVAVSPGGNATGKNASLASAAHVKGTVTNSAAAPIAFASVDVYELVDGAWEYEKGVFAQNDGTYDAGGLTAGTYRLGFSGFGYDAEFWDNQPTLATATNVVVGAGATVAGRNAVLASAAHIKGTVTDSASAPLADVDVSAYRQVGGGWDYETSDFTNSNGAFDIDNLPPGTYRLEYSKHPFTTEYWNNKSTLNTATNIVVAAGATVTGKNASLAFGGHITGTVTDSAALPLEFVGVTAYQLIDGTWEFVTSASTEADGTYDIDGLAPGTYRIGFFESPYVDEYWDNAATVETATDIVVPAGGTAANKNASLVVGGHITGQVTNSAAAPIEDIEVTAYRLVAGNWVWVNSDWTGSDGTYDLDGLATGTYRIGFEDGSFSRNPYIDEWWDNATSLPTATSFAVTAGGTTAGKNAVLTAGARVLGRLTDEAGAGVPGIDVSAYRLVGGVYVEERSVDSDARGNYDLNGLPAGTYRLGFEDPDGSHGTEFWNDAAALSTATGFTVAAAAVVTGKNAVLAPAGEITGLVTGPDAKPLRGIEVSVYQQVGANYVEIDQVRTTRDIGSYHVDGLRAGSYRLRFHDWQDRYASEFFDNASSLATATTIAVTAGSTAAGKNAQLLASTGTVPGAPTVTGTTPSGGAITVAFTPGSDGGSPITEFSAVCTSTDGGVTRTKTGTASPITLTGLTGNKNYRCRVRATNAVGTGPYSAYGATVLVPLTAPAAPTVTGSTPSGGAVTVAFTPGSDGGSPVTGFTASCVSTDGGVSKARTGTASPITVIGLTGNKNYRCRVRATNAVGTGLYSAYGATVLVPLTAPAAPTVTGSTPSAGQVTVAFTPNADGGSPITGFAASCVSTDGGVARSRTGTASPITVTLLSSGKNYHCRVRATNAVGTGGYSPYGATVLVP